MLVLKDYAFYYRYYTNIFRCLQGLSSGFNHKFARFFDRKRGKSAKKFAFI